MHILIYYPPSDQSRATGDVPKPPRRLSGSKSATSAKKTTNPHTSGLAHTTNFRERNCATSAKKTTQHRQPTSDVLKPIHPLKSCPHHQLPREKLRDLREKNSELNTKKPKSHKVLYKYICIYLYTSHTPPTPEREIARPPHQKPTENFTRHSFSEGGLNPHPPQEPPTPPPRARERLRELRTKNHPTLKKTHTKAPTLKNPKAIKHYISIYAYTYILLKNSLLAAHF